MPTARIEIGAGTYDTDIDGTPGTVTVPTLTAGSIDQASPSIGDTLTVSGSNASATATFQWQQSADGSTGWTNIGGAISASLDTSSGVTDDYYVRRQTSDGAQGPVDTSAVQVTAAAAYTQNIVATNGVARLDADTLPSDAQCTMSFWISDQGIGDFDYFIGTSFTPNGGIQVRKRSGDLRVRVYDSAGTLVYENDDGGANALSTTSGTLTHVQVNVDLAVPSINIYIDGSDVTADFGTSISAGTGVVGGERHIVPNEPMELADIFISWGEIIPNATLYNGGTPPDPGTISGGPLIGSPEILLGGDMVASDWDAGTNIGTAAITVNTTGFTDV